MTTVATRRKLPGRQSTCPACKRLVVVAMTVAGENGPGGKYQYFEPLEDPAGNVAIVPRGPNRTPYARALKRGETHDGTVELRGMPHVAVCQPVIVDPPKPPPANVVDFKAARAARRQRGRR